MNIVTTKPVNELAVGDRVKIVNPDGVAVIESIEPHPTKQAEGGCFLIDLRITNGDGTGERHTKVHAGVDKVVLA